MRGFLVSLGAAVVMSVAVPGCGPARTDVTGTVTYKGKSVVYGTVSVVGSDQVTYYGTIQESGAFTVSGVPVGPVKLGVFSPDPYFEPPISAAEKARHEEARRASGVPVPPKPPKGKWFRLPGKYADPLTSGLTAELTNPGSPIDLRLD
ncbi:hypothetical protein R5W23_001989 [Gemmata sp. JC673]|uniref:Carboxypeptidase regulatory-like domain-containing protein n=1 Tax=Gemmata algarum TaxID=2975278 RepID=A0ABU5F3M1_9BACT|nr:hypothetical protein [Gemmata algarum]MDY3560743.1 hypothetical protein [Gemmata algarum]